MKEEGEGGRGRKVEECRKEQRGKPERERERVKKDKDRQNIWQQMSYTVICYPLRKIL